MDLVHDLAYFKKLMLQEEPLPLTRFLIEKIYEYILKRAKITNLAISFGVFLIFMQVMSLVFDTFELERIPVISFYVFGTTLMTLSKIANIKKMFDIKKDLCFSLDCAGLKTKANILKFAAREDKTLLILSTLFFGSRILSANFMKYDFTLTLLKNSYLILYLPYLIFLEIWITLAFLLILFKMYVYMYFIVHYRIQIIILANFLKEISADFKNYTVVGRLQDDKYYQQVIWKRLKFIIAGHIDIIRACRSVLECMHINLSATFFIVTGSGLVVGIFLLLVLELMIAVVLFFLAASALCLDFIFGRAQKCHDTCEDFVKAALTVPWYEWDIQNRKAYLLLLQMAMEFNIFKFSFLNINRALELQVIRKLYAAATVLSRMRIH